MCGLVGGAGDLSHQFRTRVFKDMLDVCQVRGRDSTGVIKVSKKDQEYDWVKQLGSPAYLYDGRQYAQRVETGEASVLIGHCRAKTVGEVSVKNAHPFDFPEEGIVGVHNGTLRNTHSLPGYAHGQVDSEILYENVAKRGAAEVFGDIEGAWACVWWNDKEKTLNFIRNSERPLYFTWSKDRRQMFWASELWMFGAVSRHIELWDGGESGKVYYQMPVDELWSFQIDASTKAGEPVMRMKPIKKIAMKEVRPAYAGFRNGGNYNPSKTTAWKRDPVTGVTTRVQEPLKEGTLNKGGEVNNPFSPESLKEKYPNYDSMSEEQKAALVRYERIKERKQERERQKTIDDLYELGTTTDSNNSKIDKVGFLTISASSSDTSKGKNIIKTSVRPKLSLPDKNSKVQHSSNNVVHLNVSKGSISGSLNIPNKKTLKVKSGVSFRTVAGIDYITDNKTGNETDVVEFLHNTSGACVFCKDTITSINEVAEIVDKNSFLCIDCIEEPKEIFL